MLSAPVSVALRRKYDHRIREAIVESGDVSLFPGLRIPKSTRHTWVRRGLPKVVTAEDSGAELVELRIQVARLRKQIQVLIAILRLLLALVRSTGASLSGIRVPSAGAKARILRALEHAKPFLGHRAALRILGMRQARLREWTKAAAKCELDDAPPCPRSRPGCLTFTERSVMRDMVEADGFKHLSIRSLAILAQRLGRVFASYETRCRAIKRYHWNRPRRRVYPAKPRVGIRADGPGQLLHVDVTTIRLLDGTRAFLHAVVDNYSRRVIACSLEANLTAETTRRLLNESLEAIQATALPIRVVTDGGCENLVLAEMKQIAHVVAQVDITQSNSMVEALWLQIKSWWLFLHTLDSFATLQRLVEKYFDDHNKLIPRAELGGRTPNEAFFGREDDLQTRLRVEHAKARYRRVAENQARTCSACVRLSPESVM